jgi:hypothetical protein
MDASGNRDASKSRDSTDTLKMANSNGPKAFGKKCRAHGMLDSELSNEYYKAIFGACPLKRIAGKTQNHKSARYR